MARLTDLNAQVIGISVNDPLATRLSQKKTGCRFPILSDYKREVIKTYGLESAEFFRS